MSNIHRPTYGNEFTKVEMTQIVMPGDANNHGTAFGGQMVAWMDICASVSGKRFARSGALVTASMDQIHFLQPVHRGMFVTLRSQVNQAWNSSMEIGVRVEAEDPASGDVVHCCSAYLTFVALNEHGKPGVVPILDPGDDPENQRRARQAQERRDARLAMRRKRNPTP
jgi:acyl-CoA hydrolase